MSASTPNGQTRAAQYLHLRMSSESQIYSTENQRTAIVEYAVQHGYPVVASYIDAGKSGLSLKGRLAERQRRAETVTQRCAGHAARFRCHPGS
ncbi:recombinase family protein [Bradyrhizobium sp. USDA 3315]